MQYILQIFLKIYKTLCIIFYSSFSVPYTTRRVSSHFQDWLCCNVFRSIMVLFPILTPTRIADLISILLVISNKKGYRKELFKLIFSVSFLLTSAVSSRRTPFYMPLKNGVVLDYRLLWSLTSTSCAPPSTMEVAETRVSFAFFWSSGMFKAPQLHIVERILLSVVIRLSCKEPAYGT